MSQELVTIATFLTAHEAQMARGLLEANEMECFMADEAMTRIASHLIPMIGGMKLQVRPEDVEKARELLSPTQSDQIDDSPP
jgi:hypothetical protein